MPYVEGEARVTTFCAVCGDTEDWHPNGVAYEAAKARGYTPEKDHGLFVAGKVQRTRTFVWVEDGTEGPARDYVGGGLAGPNTGD